MTKTYFFPDWDFNGDFFGSSDQICFDRAEIERLAEEWETPIEELMSRMHEATDEEIATYGVYDSES